VRALKERCGGKLFEARVKALCRISKSNAHAIIHEGLGEPPRIDEIWERTHAELHSADATAKSYRLPTLSKCLAGTRNLIQTRRRNPMTAMMTMRSKKARTIAAR
jgi:hypothetical protein